VEIDWLEGLESRVHDAVEQLAELREENRKLREAVKNLETRLAAGGSAWEVEREEVRRRVEALTARLEGLAGE